jgi:rhamnopyranosyl-N-acetylglucosaminyl-diphospho-decaprenol beta-1,3/1,4-galactofuranosyltransferase
LDRRRDLEKSPQGKGTLASMNPDFPEIAAVFATMNRSHVAVACVKSLAAQTRHPRWVVVADNASDDSTPEDLEAIPNLPFALTVLRMPENEGNAGGVRAAMDLAFAKGADAVWILDDDSWPRPDALEAMLEEPYDDSLVLHPLQIDPASGKFTWPLQIFSGGKWSLAFSMDELPAGKRTKSRGVWTGALVSRKIREAIGPVRGELFIRGEDEEYPWRMAKAGFAHAAVHSAILDHPGPPDIVHWSFLGKHFFFERGLPDWKLHYKIRNMIWLKRKQSGGPKALLTFSAYLTAVCIFDGLHRLRLLFAAFRDGWCGRLGKLP